MQRSVHAHLFEAEVSREPTGFTRLRTVTSGIGFVACAGRRNEPACQLITIHNMQLIEFGNDKRPLEEFYQSQESRIPMEPQHAAAKFYEALDSHLKEINLREPELFEKL